MLTDFQKSVTAVFKYVAALFWGSFRNPFCAVLQRIMCAKK